jgi:hypothetical protein
LVVKPPQGTQQVWESIVSANQAPSYTTVDFRSTGPVVLSETMQGPQGNEVCTFNPPLPTLPWPPVTGKTFNSTGSCGGGLTVRVSGQLGGQQTDVVAGQSFEVWVLNATIDASGDGLNASGTEVAWLSPALRLPLHEYTSLKGTYAGVFSFTSQLTTDIVSGPGL